MLYSIDRSSHEPAYLQLYHMLVRDITSGVYPRDKKLPSKRTISDDVGISVITVEHALSLLVDEGYIEARERSGYYVIYREDDFLTDASHKKENTGLSAKTPVCTESVPQKTGDFPFSVILYQPNLPKLIQTHSLHPHHRGFRPINLLLGGGDIGKWKIGEPLTQFGLGPFQPNIRLKLALERQTAEKWLPGI